MPCLPGVSAISSSHEITSGPLSRLLIRISLALDNNQRYQRAKAWARHMLKDEHSRRKHGFDLFIIAVVIISVALLMISVTRPLGPLADWFEVIALFIFVTEYLLRLWVCSDIHKVILHHYQRAEVIDSRFQIGAALRQVIAEKWRYITTPMAIIDLLAILPSYRSIRLLRVFMLFRLFKLFRYARTVQIIADTMAEKRFEFFTLFMFAGFMVLVGSTAIYLFEGALPEQSGVNNFFDAIYWTVVTLSTVGYGDITPVTSEGRLVAMVVIASGIGVFAFSTSIIVSALHDRMGEIRTHRVASELERKHGYTVVCGYGRVGQAVVDRLMAEDEQFVVIERDPARVQAASARRVRVMEGDAADAGIMLAAGLADRAAAVLCVTDDDVTNVFITVSARNMNPGLRIIASANRREVVNKLTLAGADYVVTPFESVGMVGSEYVGRPMAFATFFNIIADDHGVVLESIHIPSESRLCGQTLATLDLKCHNLVLLGVVVEGGREAPPGSPEPPDRPGQVVPPQTRPYYYSLQGHGFYYNPPADRLLQPRDSLIVMGNEFSMLKFRRFVEVSVVDSS